MDRFKLLGSQLVNYVGRYGSVSTRMDAEFERDDIELCPRGSFEESDGKEANGSVSANGGTYDGSQQHDKEANGSVNSVSGTIEPQVGTCSAWQAGWNVGNCMQGLGILSLPYTVKESGVASLITIFAVLVLGNYTSKILVDCLYDEETPDHFSGGEGKRRVRSRKSYAEVAETCWKRAGLVLNIMQIIDITAVATLYLELSGSLLVDTFPFTQVPKLAWTVISAAIVMPTIFFRNLTRISWLSFVAVIAMFAMLFSVFWYSFGKSVRWDLGNMPPYNQEGFSISFNILLFNFGSQFLMPGVEESMRDRSRFRLVINVTYLIVGVVNITYALFAFLTFGEDTKEFITYNLPVGVIQRAVSVLFVIKSLLSYPLMLFLIVSSIDSMKIAVLPPCYASTPDKSPPVWSMVFRALLVIFTLFLAIAIPHFTLLMSVTGSLTSAWLDFIFPCAFHLKLKGHTLKLYHKIFDAGIMLVGFVGGSIGLVYSIRALVQAYIQDFS